MGRTNATGLRASILVIAGLPALYLESGCGKSQAEAVIPQPAGILRTQATLAESSEQRLRGNFKVEDELYAFAVDESNGRKQLDITGPGGEHSLTIVQNQNYLEMSVYDGKASQTIDLTIIAEAARQAKLPESERSPFPAGRAIIETGDSAAFQEFTQSPVGRMIPWLSRDLGKLGITGRASPVSLPLHRLGMMINNELQLNIPALTPEEEAAAGLEVGYCQDLRPDPYRDECLGMCGPGCTCWDWVCGDCCCHDGCKSHDITCRRCRWYRPISCLLCATGVSFLWGLCGSSCQHTEYVDLPAAPLGVRCGYDAPYDPCEYHYDGSTEAAAAPRQTSCEAAEIEYAWEQHPYEPSCCWVPHTIYRCTPVP